MSESPPLCGSSPVLNYIIENKDFFSIAKHVIINFCNKPLKASVYGSFEKSIMLKSPLSHGFKNLNHGIMLGAWFSMILTLIKFCKRFKNNVKSRHASILF